MNEKDELSNFLKTNRPVVTNKTPRAEAYAIWNKINLGKQGYESFWAYAVPVLAAVMVMMYVSQADVQQVKLSKDTALSMSSALAADDADEGDTESDNNEFSYVASIMD